MSDLGRIVASEHCRVMVPDPNDLFARFEYARHLFPYVHTAETVASRAPILEIGFGSGFGAGYLAAHLGKVFAVDISLDAAVFARALYPEVHFGISTGDALPFPTGVFGSVVSFQVIEHVDNPAKFLREIGRVLRPGGECFLTTPNRRFRLFPFQRPLNEYHQREYSARTLAREVGAVFPSTRVDGIVARSDLMAMELSRVSPWRRTLERILSRVGVKRSWRPPRALEHDGGSVDVADFSIMVGRGAQGFDLLCHAVKSTS